MEIPVQSKIAWSEDFGADTPGSYLLKVYLGFDRYRIANPETGFRTQKACSLYTYSRASGRMVKYEPDARSTLGLSYGGTVFCQAMTVIIDDVEGRLPLDPTKQGLAFGNQAQGHVHEANLYDMVSCVAKFWYKHHLDKFDGRKA
eukprot:CAMPEP_0181079674 /NCGR_PEP_ID=MMETSP1071-20121207/2156_1 /TAXON_ID=35127 /ORGANISM="Thalassiosira sp., Strain NH16" /LENGTH=144 /DNA_ID=CAMNT_0023161093 /DNA_START=189 /DNA_END=623 /DNA_ORIENTATION=+